LLECASTSEGNNWTLQLRQFSTLWGAPSGVMTSPNFGRSTSAQNPREIEVGLRFQF
jgi:hypothetical protein